MHRRPLRMKAVSLFPNAHAIHKVQRGLAEICVDARCWRIPPLFFFNPPLFIQTYFFFFTASPALGLAGCCWSLNPDAFTHIYMYFPSCQRASKLCQKDLLSLKIATFWVHLCLLSLSLPDQVQHLSQEVAHRSPSSERHFIPFSFALHFSLHKACQAVTAINFPSLAN